MGHYELHRILKLKHRIHVGGMQQKGVENESLRSSLGYVGERRVRGHSDEGGCTLADFKVNQEGMPLMSRT